MFTQLWRYQTIILLMGFILLLQLSLPVWTRLAPNPSVQKVEPGLTIAQFYLVTSQPLSTDQTGSTNPIPYPFDFSNTTGDVSEPTPIASAFAAAHPLPFIRP